MKDTNVNVSAKSNGNVNVSDGEEKLVHIQLKKELYNKLKILSINLDMGENLNTVIRHLYDLYEQETRRTGEKESESTTNT